MEAARALTIPGEEPNWALVGWESDESSHRKEGTRVFNFCRDEASIWHPWAPQDNQQRGPERKAENDDNDFTHSTQWKHKVELHIPSLFAEGFTSPQTQPPVLHWL